MSKYKFGKPYKDRDWYVFPDTTLENIDIDDCVSSVTGKCEIVNTIDDCIKVCENNQPCFAGYFLETPDKKNICVPVRKITAITGLYYRLRNPSIYPEFANVKSSVFTSKDYKYPPDHGNVIFYTDKFALQNVKSGKSIGISEEGKLNAKNILTDNPVFVQFLPKEINRTDTSQYIVVYSGDQVIINIPGTAYILKNEADDISWVMKLTSIENSENIFRVFAYGKKDGEILNYSDILYFTGGNQPVIYNQDLGMLSRVATNVDDEKSRENMAFNVIPKVVVYYCDTNKCNSVMLENTDKNQEKASYKGFPVSRNPNCWGMCNSDSKDRWWVKLLIISGVWLVFLAILVYLKRNVF